MMMLSSRTKFVDAISNAMVAVKSAPLGAQQISRHLLSLLQGDAIGRRNPARRAPPVSRTRMSGGKTSLMPSLGSC